MIARRVAALLCVLMTVAACSRSAGTGRSALNAVGSASPTPAPVPTVTTPTTSPTITSSAVGSTTRASHSTSKSPSSPKPSHAASAAPDNTDYAVAWTNADCSWNVGSDGTAHVSADEYITATVLHTSGTVKSTVTTNGGGIPTGSDAFPATFLKPGQLPFIYSISAPAADFESHSITFTATLTFSGVPDQLGADNSSSLVIHFPVSFVAGNDGDENLGCDHVNN